MINNHITARLLGEGLIKRGGIIEFNPEANSYFVFQCKITKIIKDGKDTILKLRTGKNYPFGHKFIYRSLEEVNG